MDSKMDQENEICKVQKSENQSKPNAMQAARKENRKKTIFIQTFYNNFYACRYRNFYFFCLKYNNITFAF